MHEHQNDYPTDATNATLTLDDSIVRRLLAVGHHLVADGLLASEAEMTVFNGLTADTPRASLFRAGIGLAAPLDRDRASRLADAIGRALRGPRDTDFPRQYALAHARGAWQQAAHDSAERLRRDGAPLTRDNLALSMMLAVTRVRPESELILRNPSNLSIETRIDIGATDYFGGTRE